MGSPSLRTFRNRINRAEIEAASLSSAAFFRSLRPAGTGGAVGGGGRKAGGGGGVEKPEAPVEQGSTSALSHILGSQSLS